MKLILPKGNRASQTQEGSVRLKKVVPSRMYMLLLECVSHVRRKCFPEQLFPNLARPL